MSGELETSSDRFESEARAALADEALQASLGRLIGRFPALRQAAVERLPEFEELRNRARDIRQSTLDDLDFYLERFESEVRRAGGQVHWARSAAQAREVVRGLCRQAGARSVIKSKSMVTEEIGLNAALQEDGLRVVETDLGEYIVQLRGERPSHILAPAIHLTRHQVAETFHAHHTWIEREQPLEARREMVNEARGALRREFVGADVGITGANFLIAESGGVIVVTNEGNADLAATLPRTHVVVTGIEKVVPTLDEASVLLRLLARSATGQDFGTYTTLFHGPRRAADSSGPESFHVVLVDNGRSDMLGTDLHEMLRCIRCSACINHCPVYAATGGHAYGSVYSGPMGAVLTPGLAGIERTRHLPNASMLCGRCEEVCPVHIPLPRMLRYWRDREFERHLNPRSVRHGLRSWSWLSRSPRLYRWALSIAARCLRWWAGGTRHGQRWIRRLPGVAGGWTAHRDLRAPDGASFQTRWRRR